ncbi:MAG: host-nuclease inhibitor Gam family protein [Sphingobacteriia bacterium]|nr:host-nuclease inhibitor Gam family protein [Sphingobacteriia bacterium]
MTESENFLDELLAEAEAKEEQYTESYFDLLLTQVQQMQDQIAHNFSEADKEVAIIKQWALNKNHGLQVKIEWIEKKLEAFIRERKVKTLDLPHGVLKVHKKPDKVEITDLELFLKNARPEMLSVMPESVKPDLSKIKAYVKTHYTPPPGIKVIEGKEEFSYKLNNRKDDEDGGQEETGVAVESAVLGRIAV